MAAVPPVRVSLSTSSLYPGSTASAFETAARLGYDGVEIMVGVDEISTDIEAVARLSQFHEIPVVSVHAPTLLLTQRVWGTEPWGKLHRSADMARAVGCETVVVHPPFRWQREYAAAFVEGVAELEQQHGIVYAVENMYPWRTGRRAFQAYAPDWDPVGQDYAHVTVDLSHSGTAKQDPVQMVRDLGPRLAHVHMADSAGSAKDEHLIPGRGTQPCAEFLAEIARQGFTGEVVIEVNTRKAPDTQTREHDLTEALEFCRTHLGQSGP
ncbi:MAG: sugar phosphate isomerase/epimerase [Aeromicrobium sp.]|uniref:sugar phosphate isomerase/epimerase family protein n=1 Tax=Aeromicrobium sp. TaxID=1871063 RepID=UPI0039E68E8C